MIDHITRDIQVAKERESMRAPTTAQDIIQYLALNTTELDALTQHYKQMDTDDSGEIDLAGRVNVFIFIVSTCLNTTNSFLLSCWIFTYC
jgi:hypothetical protein